MKDFYLKKDKLELYWEQLQLEANLLKELNKYLEVEEVWMSAFANQKLSADWRLTAGTSIFSIDKFYNPKADLESCYEKIVDLADGQTSDAIKDLSLQVLYKY